jgi:hypothetical protein
MTLVTIIHSISVLNNFRETIYNRLILFIHKHNVSTDAQNGFRENKSTETAN